MDAISTPEKDARNQQTQTPSHAGTNAYVNTTEEHHARTSGRGGAFVGGWLALHNLLKRSESTTHDILTTIGEKIDSVASALGIAQSTLHLGEYFSKNTALIEKFKSAEKGLDDAGIAGSVVSGGFVAAHGVITENTQEMASGTLGVTGALAVGAGGAAVGATVGAAVFGALGSVVPVAGTAAGIAVGSTVGEFVGGAIGGWAGSKIGTAAGEAVLNETNRLADFVQGNNDAIRTALAAKGITQEQLKEIDKNGLPTAQEVRVFLKAHHFMHVDRGTPQALADAAAATLIAEKITSNINQAAHDAASAARVHVLQAGQPMAAADVTPPLVFAKVHSLQSRTV